MFFEETHQSIELRVNTADIIGPEKDPNSRLTVRINAEQLMKTAVQCGRRLIGPYAGNYIGHFCVVTFRGVRMGPDLIKISNRKEFFVSLSILHSRHIMSLIIVSADIEDGRER